MNVDKAYKRVIRGIKMDKDKGFNSDSYYIDENIACEVMKKVEDDGYEVSCARSSLSDMVILYVQWED